jgi:L-2-hydroxyglutarate oxidase LhgO
MGESDVVVVGAGIVGLAVAREVMHRRPGATITVVEKESAVAAHQTGHNSGVIHGGVYYEPGSLKARLCVEGARLMYDYAAENNIPHERCGKLIVALKEKELPQLHELERRGIANGVPGLRRVGAAEITAIEPHATGIAALHAPNTGIIDYAEVSRTIQRELTEQGVTFLFDTEVRRVTDDATCKVDLGASVLGADQVIVCAGLWSDRLARRSGADPDPRIIPFRGAYLRLKPSADPAVHGMVYPVPDPTLPFLGVHVTKHIDGHIMLGPTAMMVPSRDGYRFRTLRYHDIVDTATWPGTWKVVKRFWRTGLIEIRMAASKRAYVRAAAEYVPSLDVGDLDGTFHSGVRAQAVGADGTLLDDFDISQVGRITHVRNAPSPAATSAFALARELVDRIDGR